MRSGVVKRVKGRKMAAVQGSRMGLVNMNGGAIE